jgi:uncharacterized protein (DUF342 family)
MSGDRIEVKLSPDRMSAEIRISPVEPPPTIPEIHATLASSGVLFGLKDDAIRSALAAPQTWVRIAEGVPVTPPRHGRMEIQFDVQRKPHLKQDSDGNVDLKELGMIENVKSGTVLAVLLDPIAGSPGRSVSGDYLPPEPARVGELKPGRNVAVSHDGREIVAAIDGRALLDTDGRVTVDNVFTVVGDVGPATGNIVFLGSVVVKGNVCSDYRVKASEKIIVTGSVEGALLESGQDITIQGGVFGAERAVLQARGDIRALQAQDARFLCGGTITAERGLVRVNAVAAREIHCERGVIVGGSACAPGIVAQGLGSEAETRTIVEIGIAPRARLTCQRLEQEFLAARQELGRARLKLHPLETQQHAGKILDADDKALMDRLIEEIHGLERRILLAAAEMRTVLNDPATNIAGRLSVAGHVHPGVVISTARAEQVIREHRMGLTLRVEDGKAVTAGEEGAA